MITAFILMNVRRDAINETAQELQGINGISEVYSVSGRYIGFTILFLCLTDTNELLRSSAGRRRTR